MGVGTGPRGSSRARGQRPKQPDYLPLELGPWDHVSTQLALPGKRQLLYDALNCLPRSLGGVEGETAWAARPGIWSYSDIVAAGSRAQGGWQFTKLDGTEYSVFIMSGRVFLITPTWVGATLVGVVTEPITGAQLALAGVTLDATARVGFCTFNDKLIVNDGVNRPWSWDGTVGGGITSLTNAPVRAYGRPTVYYGKLFFIVYANRNKIVWSEELAENTGYEAGGYTNRWTLGQTDQEALFNLYGTNEALYFTRRDSIGKIEGEVSTTFSSDGTVDGVSTEIGCPFPFAFEKIGDYFWFLDSLGRMQRFRIGTRALEPIWEQLEGAGFYSDIAGSGRPYNEYDPDIGYYSDSELVLFNTAKPAAEGYCRVFRQSDARYIGRWQAGIYAGAGPSKQIVLAQFKNADKKPLLAFMAYSDVMRLTAPTESATYDYLRGAGGLATNSAISCELYTQQAGRETRTLQKLFLEADLDHVSVSYGALTSTVTITLQSAVPSGPSSSVSVAGPFYSRVAAAVSLEAGHLQYLKLSWATSAASICDLAGWRSARLLYAPLGGATPSTR